EKKEEKKELVRLKPKKKGVTHVVRGNRSIQPPFICEKDDYHLYKDYFVIEGAANV
ncbi:MAG: hypothetical protein GY765_02825, partial [bacterium]|nr:hypothetical protein [bacterium]